MPLTTGAAGYSFGSDDAGRMVLVDGNSTWVVVSTTTDQVVWVPRSREYMITMRNGVPYKTTFSPDQRAQSQVYTMTTGLPCSLFAQAYPSVRAVKPDAATIQPRLFGNSYVTMVVDANAQGRNASVVSIDAAAWTNECIGDPACGADLQTDHQHCGFCSVACQASETCVSGQCVPGPGSRSSAPALASGCGCGCGSTLILSVSVALFLVSF
jgi:hypothetical protein